MNFLDTTRLVLRNVKEEDLETIFEYRNNDDVVKFQRGQIRDRDELFALIINNKNNNLDILTNTFITVVLKDTNEVIGEILVMPNTNDLCISLGYTIAMEYQRKGYALEALSALIVYLHHQYPNYSFVSLVDPKNTASIQLLKKLGYQYLDYSKKINSDIYGKWMPSDYKKHIKWFFCNY